MVRFISVIPVLDTGTNIHTPLWIPASVSNTGLAFVGIIEESGVFLRGDSPLLNFIMGGRWE